MFSVDSTNMIIALTRGDTAQITFSAVDSDDIPYVPQEGDRLSFSVAKKPGAEPIFSIVNVMESNPDDFWDVTILPEHTEDMKFGDYAFDAQITHDGYVDTIIGETDNIHPTFRVWGEVTPSEEP